MSTLEREKLDICCTLTNIKTCSNAPIRHFMQAKEAKWIFKIFEKHCLMRKYIKFPWNNKYRPWGWLKDHRVWRNGRCNGRDYEVGNIEYSDIYEGWKSDPDGFWIEAAKAIDWTKPPSFALDSTNALLFRVVYRLICQYLLQCTRSTRGKRTSRSNSNHLR